MKLLLFCIIFCSLQGFACSENYLKNATDTEKFLAVVKGSPVVFIGEVVRLYRMPGSASYQKGKNGFVLRVLEPIKGDLSPFVEMERGSWCAASSSNDEGYWPEKVGQKFIVAGRLDDDGLYIVKVANAVYPYENNVTLMQKVYSIANKSINQD